MSIRWHLLWWLITALGGGASAGLTSLVLGDGLTSFALQLGLAGGALIGLLCHLPFVIFILEDRR